MPWWDKALKSVQDGAEKAAFEADRLVRIRREETALGEARNQLQGKVGDLGQAALALLRSGALNEPSLAAIAQEIAGIEAQIKQQEEKIEAIRSEQKLEDEAAPAVQPAAPIPAAVSPAAAAPVAPVAAAPAPVPPIEAPSPLPQSAAVEPPAAPAMAECPNCHTQVRPNAAFCPECGTRLKA